LKEEMTMSKLHIRKDDTVVVISGNSKGTVGKVIATSPEEGKVMVQGANIVSKHQKARKQGETSTIVKTEAAMYASKVMLVCPKCNKGVRVKHNVTKNADGKRVVTRICAKCGAEI